MVFGIQIVGVLFALIMMYLTFLYYKRNSYSGRSFALWILIWAAFLFATFFPTTLYGIMEELSIQRTVDLFVIAGFMFFSVVIFYLYVIIKSLERQIETVVRRTAIAAPLLPRAPKRARGADKNAANHVANRVSLPSKGVRR